MMVLSHVADTKTMLPDFLEAIISLFALTTTARDGGVVVPTQTVLFLGSYSYSRLQTSLLQYHSFITP